MQDAWQPSQHASSLHRTIASFVAPILLLREPLPSSMVSQFGSLTLPEHEGYRTITRSTSISTKAASKLQHFSQAAVPLPSAMRLFSLLLPISLASALQLPNFESFLSALPISLNDYIQPNTTSPPPHDLLKRQFSNTCPTNFHACNNLGAPGLCCASQAVCSADANGNVACCPSGAQCSGTINGVITAGTVNQDGSLISATTGTGTSSFVSARASTTGLVAASVGSTTTTQRTSGSNTGGGFIIDGTSTVASPGLGVRGVDVVSLLVLLESREGTNELAAVVREDDYESAGVFADMMKIDLNVQHGWAAF